MQVLVTYGGDPIPKSPFTVGVAAPLDLSKIKINGLENSKCVDAGRRVTEDHPPGLPVRFLSKTICRVANSALRDLAVGQTWV